MSASTSSMSTSTSSDQGEKKETKRVGKPALEHDIYLSVKDIKSMCGGDPISVQSLYGGTTVLPASKFNIFESNPPR